MGKTINLRGTAAIEKIREIATREVAMLCTFRGPEGTNGHDTPPSKGTDHFETRPMHTQRVDDDGVLWFLSDARSATNAEIEANDHVQLVYAVPQSSTYLCVRGSAFITKNREDVEATWSPLATAWFEGGKDDPNLTLIAVRPHEGRYWDSKHGKVIQLMGIVLGAVTGKPTDDGRDGKLRP